MSNYFFSIGRKEEIKKLHDIFTTPISNSESTITLNSISKQYSILIIEKRRPHINSSISENCDPFTGVFFKGWCEDHENSSIILGKRGIEKYFSSIDIDSSFSEPFDKEGTFVLATWDEKVATIQNDLYSLFPIIYCHTKSIFMASDSLLLISHCRKALSIPCKLNEKVALGKAWRTHGIASTPLCNETIIEGVKSISPGKHIRLEMGSSISLETIHRPLTKIFCNTDIDYQKNLHLTIQNMAASIYNVAIQNDINIQLGLSGGLDSRVLLGICLQSEKIMDALYIQTSIDSMRSEDFDIVESLSKEFNFVFNDLIKKASRQQGSSTPIKKIDNQLGLWALANLGLCDSIFLTKNIWEIPTTIRMGGQGAETVKDSWSGFTIDNLISKGVRDEVRHSVSSQMHDALVSSGIDPSGDDAIKWHHLAYKSAWHNGRFVTQSPLCLRPFLNRNIFSIYNSSDNPFINSGRESPTICHDLLLLLSKKLAYHPYDSEEKNITEKYAESRIKELEGPLQKLSSKPYRTFGSILDIANGPPDCFLSLVENYRLDGLSVRDKLKHLMLDNWEKIQQYGLFYPYKLVYSQGIEKLESSTSELSFAATYATRICSFSLLDAPTTEEIKKINKKLRPKQKNWIIKYIKWRYKKITNRMTKSSDLHNAKK